MPELHSQTYPTKKKRIVIYEVYFKYIKTIKANFIIQRGAIKLKASCKPKVTI